jgi:hypothetical protein
VQAASTSPGNFTVTGTPYCETSHGTPTGAVLLEWGQSSTATSYDIIRDGATIATGVTELGARNTSSDLTGQTHSYVVRAHNSSTTTTDSNGGVAVTVTVPSNVCASFVLPAPTISSINPSTVTGSSSSTTFTVTGSNFVNGAKVQVGYASNGYTFVDTNNAASYVNASTLTVPIITLTQADTWRVRVKNPDGQTSSGYVSLVVNAPVTTLVVNGIASSYAATSGSYQPTINLSGSGFSSIVNQIYLTCARNGTSCGTYTWNSANWSGKYFVFSDISAMIAPVLTVSSDPAGTYSWSVAFSGGGQSVTKYFTVTK